MEFKWNLRVDKISIENDKRKLTLKKDGTLVFSTPYCITDINISEIGYINVRAPKLLVKGIIGLFNTNGDGMQDKDEFPIAVWVSKKYEKSFNSFVEAMQENGIDIRYLS